MTQNREIELLNKKKELELELSVITDALKTCQSYRMEQAARDVREELKAVIAELEALSKTCPRCQKTYTGIQFRKSRKKPDINICPACYTDELILELGYDSDLDPKLVRAFEAS